ncbi:TonB-dependent receptor [Pseudohaliea rubra]|uniref:TonB-dependent receptor n=1 Tax=Pseudohaliea rubra DSM 19751 TaxID=1265313 RepID=A0A095VN75_9GAMM|nr:TonB-dependent receptor [Pseudohaliea rubra]KGE02548.1 TonB-dependent receptor [Pseudohaliea rubra DSM 19751]
MQRSLSTALLLATTAAATPAIADEAGARPVLEEVLVTARKRSERAIEAPVAVTAFSAEDLDTLKARDLTRLSAGLPGVLLDDVGTRRGTANFSIRGLGINSSIPSIDPAVGVFVNGVYLAVNNDTVFDIFDLERIEVLRGPQGILFGRNVTGGAVLLETRKPGERFEAALRGAVEGGGNGGLSRYLMGSLSGPLSDSLKGRLVLYGNDDQGWFENLADGEDFGAVEQAMARGTLVWEPTAADTVTLFYERTDIDGEGAATQSHTNGSGIPGTPRNFPRDSHEFAIDERGYQSVESDFLTLRWDRAVGFGEGTLTNIFGWREQSSVAMSDIDGQPAFLFHSPGWIDAEQWSNELRYRGEFGPALDLTAGLYLFAGDLAYHDRRLFLGESGVPDSAQFTQDGGGTQELSTAAVFVAADYDLGERWTVSTGLRLSREEKQVHVASFNLNPTPCNIVVSGDCPFDFKDSEQWQTVAPRLGVSYRPDEDRHGYLSWTRGFRSGGYNLRNSNAAQPPGPYDEEQVDTVEVGYKLRGDAWALDAALYHTRVEDMQREVNLPSGTAGILQLIRNTASAELSGAELDLTIEAGAGVTLAATASYLDARYTKVRFDLDGNGTVDGADKDLALPRAPEWTGSLEARWQGAVASGRLDARVAWNYRDRVAYTDNNLGYILAQDLVDLDLAWTSPDGHWTVAGYARNLLNEVKHGGDSQLPAVFIGEPLGGAFSPLARGRIVGVSLDWRLGS